MANTYTQLYIQIVFCVKFRARLIDLSWEQQLYKYITAIVQNNGHKLLQINGMPDHVHLLIGLYPNQSIADLMCQVKGDSSKWINEKGFTRGRFAWQPGYGAFSYSKSHLPNVIRYIQNQKQHHNRKKFISEYKELLEKYEIDYDERYIFEPLK